MWYNERTWGFRAGDEGFRIQAHAGVATSVAFSPEGKRIATSGLDHVVTVWDAKSGMPAIVLPTDHPMAKTVTLGSHGTLAVADGSAGQNTVWLTSSLPK